MRSDWRGPARHNPKYTKAVRQASLEYRAGKTEEPDPDAVRKRRAAAKACVKANVEQANQFARRDEVMVPGGMLGIVARIEINGAVLVQLRGRIRPVSYSPAVIQKLKKT